MAFNPSGTASSIWGDFSALYGTPGTTQPNLSTAWVNIFATYYDAHAAAGTMTPPAVVLVPNSGLLVFPNTSNTPATADSMGGVVADWWATQLTPGAPQHGGSISLVVNDAPKVGPLIAAGLKALGQTPPLEPKYEEIINIIDTHVKTIVWTITEVIPAAPPVVYTVAVS